MTTPSSPSPAPVDAPPLFTASDLPAFSRHVGVVPSAGLFFGTGVGVSGTGGVGGLGRMRQFRQRSRSFDAAFIDQLAYLHQQQPALPNNHNHNNQHKTYQDTQLPQLQQSHSTSQAGQQHPPPTFFSQHSSPLPSTFQANTTASIPPVPPRSGRTSPLSSSSPSGPLVLSVPGPKRERLLREAYLSPQLANGPPPSSPKHSISITRVGSRAHSPTQSGAPLLRNSRSVTSSPRTKNSNRLHFYHSAGLSNQGGFVALGGPMTPYQVVPPPSFELSYPSFGLPNGLPPVSPGRPLLSNRANLLHPLQLPTHSPNGQPIYGWINTVRNRAPPGDEPVEPQQPTSPTNSNERANTANTGTTAEGETKPPATLLELHDTFVEVSDTKEKEKKSTKEKKPKSSNLPAIRTKKEPPASNEEKTVTVTNDASVPMSTVSETYEQRVARENKKLAAAAAAAKEEARKKERVAAREAQALAKLADAEADKARAEAAEKARIAKLKQEKAKQREALAESAQRRARQTEKAKEADAILQAQVEAEREKERQDLARLKSQLPLPTFFNPTLAYALKVEPSAHTRDRGKRPSFVVGSGVGGRVVPTAATTSATATAAASTAAQPHGRKHSLYDGSDWDELNSLSSAAKGGGSNSGDATSVGKDGSTLDPVEDDDGDDEEHGDDEHLVDEDDGTIREEDENVGGADDQQAGGEDANSSAATGVGASAGPTGSGSTTSSTSDLTLPKSPPASSGVVASPRRGGHARTISSVAREHIASQFTKITEKHVTSKKVLQTRRKETKARLAQQVTVKQEKIDAIKVARLAELKRMQAAMDAQIADEDAAGKSKSYVLAMKLAKAAKEGDCDRIRALASDSSETEGDIAEWVNRHDSAGSTAIFHATWVAAIPALELLFKIGAEPNIINNRHNTALHLACDRCHYPVIRLLIYSGANPLLKNHERNAPFEMQSKNSAESLEMALYLRQCLEDLILEKGDGTDTKEMGAGMANFVVQSDAAAPTTPTPTTDPVTPPAPGNTALPLVPTPPSTANPASPTGDSRGSTPLLAPGSNANRRVRPANVGGGGDPLRRAQPAMDASEIVLSARQHLVGINAYITARIQLSQSMRRIRMKIWCAIRFSRAQKMAALLKKGAAEAEADNAGDADADAADGDANENGDGDVDDGGDGDVDDASGSVDGVGENPVDSTSESTHPTQSEISASTSQSTQQAETGTMPNTPTNQTN